MNKRIWMINEQSIQNFYSQHHLNDKKFYRLIQDAEISFTKSIRSGRHKVYALIFTDGNHKKAHCFARMTDESFVVEFIPGIRTLKAFKKMKRPTNGARIVHVPTLKHLIYSDENPALKEHLRSIGIQNDIQLQKQLLSGSFDYQKSRLNELPRPIHVFE